MARRMEEWVVMDLLMGGMGLLMEDMVLLMGEAMDPHMEAMGWAGWGWEWEWGWVWAWAWVGILIRKDLL
jgi:hypothetical protein